MKSIWKCLRIAGGAFMLGWLAVAAVFYAVISFGGEFIDHATNAIDHGTIAIKSWLFSPISKSSTKRRSD